MGNGKKNMGLSDACVGVIQGVWFKVYSILQLGLNNNTTVCFSPNSGNREARKKLLKPTFWPGGLWCGGQ